MLDPFSRGFFLGIVAGEGHFGGDGKQPQLTLRMHVRHQQLFDWLQQTFPDSRLYGPYHHGGRHYYQWMARGRCLREQIVPLVAEHFAFLDAYVRERFVSMCHAYQIQGPWESEVGGVE